MESAVNFLKTRWQLVIAAVILLVGAFFGGVLGGLAGAFAGDSWWPNRLALTCYQYAAGFGGVCFGAIPGMIWMFILRHRWVLPFLCVGFFALIFEVFSAMSLFLYMDNTIKGFLYAGLSAFSWVIGLLIWLFVFRARIQTSPS